MKKAKCFDCGRPYGDEHGFPDLLIPNWVWKSIAPQNNGYILLCPSCICQRLHKENLENVPFLFTSGPFQFKINELL